MTHARIRRSGLIGSAVFLLVVLGAVLTWRATLAGDPPSPPSTAEVVRGEIEESVSALGYLQPREFVDVGAQVSGQLRHLRVAIGDTVSKGQVIADIDTAVFAARLEAAQSTLLSLAAQIREKQAQLHLAQRQHERHVVLFAQDAVSREAFETSLAATQVAAAQVASLQAQRQQVAAAIRIDEANLGYARIVAPMSGTVVSLSAREGQTLNANQQAPVILRIARLDLMTVVAQVSEGDVARLRTGTAAWFTTLGRPDRRWQGVVRQILPTPETLNNVVLYSVLFDVANADQTLRTQMSAQVSFVLARSQDSVLVPVAALPRISSATVAPPSPVGQLEGRLQRVRVVRDGKVQDRQVTIGISNRVVAQVLSGLEPGERVVVGDPAESRSGAAGRRASRS